ALEPEKVRSGLAFLRLVPDRLERDRSRRDVAIRTIGVALCSFAEPITRTAWPTRILTVRADDLVDDLHLIADRHLEPTIGTLDNLLRRAELDLHLVLAAPDDRLLEHGPWSPVARDRAPLQDVVEDRIEFRLLLQRCRVLRILRERVQCVLVLRLDDAPVGPAGTGVAEDRSVRALRRE